MTYAETRDEETLRLLKPAIDAFIKACKKRRVTKSACPRQTMFFFPAGTASRLTRATRRFDDDDSSPQQFKYDPVWVTPLTLLGGARNLAIHYDGGTFRDKGDRIIVADKAVDLVGCTPHDGLIKWARKNNVLLFVFPWDWRRRLDETVTFFVGKFLRHFRDRVMAEQCPDPLATFSIVGHSFGGMIANLILRGNAPIVSGLEHVITVATPFYGYAGQVHRWFEGEDYLNFFGLFEQDMIEMIASLPGLYTLHFLDEDTFEANKDALASGDFPLPDYPSIDEQTKGVRADPFNPKTYKKLVRYPGLTGFDLAELDYAELQFKALAAPMDPTLLEKFHNIRGVKTEKDKKTPVDSTVGSVTWDWISSKYDATDTSPINDRRVLVPGDGTQPAWTTCLVTNSDRCVTVKGPAIDHAFLMNDTGVLDAIQRIVCPQGGAVSPTETAEPKPASDEEIEEFMVWLSQNLLELRNVKSFDELATRSGVPAKFQRRLPNLARRFLSDVMKRPGPMRLRGSRKQKPS